MKFLETLIYSTISRKIRPVHPGEVVSNILDDYFIAREELCEGNYQWMEMLEGERPVTNSFIIEVNRVLSIPTQLLMNLQRKVDIWDSKYETY